MQYLSSDVPCMHVTTEAPSNFAAAWTAQSKLKKASEEPRSILLCAAVKTTGLFRFLRKKDIDAVEKCKDDKEVKRVGIEWAIAQSKELKAAGAPCLHYYTMSRSEATIEIAKAVF